MTVTGRRCTIEGCARKLKCKGLCNLHYVRLQRNGTTDIIRVPVEHLVTDDGCWLWQGGLNSSGYGPHRRYYERANEPIPKGLTIDHLCKVRHCVNPEHMEVVSYQENLTRKFDAICSNGHQRTEMNTYFYNGQRMCRTCRASAARLFRARRSGRVAA